MMLFDRSFRGLLAASDAASGPWAPAVDVLEDGDHLVLRADLAGVEKDDINVRVERGRLILSGERKRDEILEGNQARHIERRHGAFRRSFHLPETVDASGIAARYRDGVLELRLPKTDRARRRRIEIAAA